MRDDDLAGVIGLRLSMEIGWAVYPSPRTRSGYCSGLLSSPPDTDTGSEGLGFRQVQWTAHTANSPSHAGTRRMGMDVWWAVVIPSGADANGIGVQKCARDDPARMQSLCNVCDSCRSSSSRDATPSISGRARDSIRNRRTLGMVAFHESFHPSRIPRA